MRRSIRYLSALLVASAVTAGVAVVSQEQSELLLFGIFGIYTLGIAIALRYPGLIWDREQGGGIASGVLRGGMFFGAMTLADGVSDTIHLGAGIMGIGLVFFGVSTGIWMVENSEIELVEDPN